MSNKKINIALLYGSNSTEHEISLRSATALLQNIDLTQFEVFPVGIDKKANWHFVSMGSLSKCLEKGKEIYIPKDAPLCILCSEEGERQKKVNYLKVKDKKYPIHVVFPMLHGSPGENGYIQGLLETLQVPYVGAGVLSSAICMDKDIAKRLVSKENLPIVPYFCTRPGTDNIDEIDEKIKSRLSYPVFIKPASLGSSLGIFPVKSKEELKNLYIKSAEYDDKILIEKKMLGREIELAALGSKESFLISAPGEIVYEENFSFFSYKAKYSKEVMKAPIRVPAKLEPNIIIKLKQLTKEIFRCLECEGMARIDFFLEKSGNIYFSEINTIPGFTAFSIYPALWKNEGTSYKELITNLVHLGLNRHKKGLARSEAIVQQLKGVKAPIDTGDQRHFS